MDKETLKFSIKEYFRGDDAAFDEYKYRYCVECDNSPKFSPELYNKVQSLIKFDDGETLFLNIENLCLFNLKWSVEFDEYITFPTLDYEQLFVNTCRLLRINNITDKERLIMLTAVEIAKKWKRAKFAGSHIDTPEKVLRIAEMVSDDVWSEANKTKSSQRYYDATTLDSPKKNKLKFKYCKQTIDRIKNDWYDRYGEEKSSLEVMKWLDGQIIKFCCEWAIKKWKNEPKENIVKNIKDNIGIKVSEKTLQKYRENIEEVKRFQHKQCKQHKPHKKTNEQMNKEQNKIEEAAYKIYKLKQTYGDKWKRYVDPGTKSYYYRKFKEIDDFITKVIDFE